MSRLTGLGSAKNVQKERLNTASQFIQSIQKKSNNEGKLTLVLKGDKTIVADSRKVYVNRTGNPGMATAGTGDVLTGIIASLIGQGYDVFDASQLGVYIHGLAGDIAAKKKGEHSMIASDIIEYLPDAFIKYNKEKGWNK
jgi:NAD(P)H-hydrate epimerase